MAEEESGGAEAEAEDCPKCEECKAGAPEWMATFADLVTLLMCFFVLLFAMSTTQEESFKELIKSLQSALGVQRIPESGTREGLIMKSEAAAKEKTEEEAIDELGGMVQKEVNEIVSDVNELIMFNKLGGNVKVEENEQGVVITISDVVIFPPGSASMTPQGLEVMKDIAEILAQFSYHIKIMGHTDNQPINTEKFDSNWELSAIRACQVVRFLETQNIDPRLMSAEGYAHYRPIATNDTEEGRAANRRVEIAYERENISKIIQAKGLR